MAECYTQYIENSLEITYGQDKEYFETWCEESDNLVDYQEEYEDDDEFHGEGED
jgi:hypothetical protein